MSSSSPSSLSSEGCLTSTRQCQDCHNSCKEDFTSFQQHHEPYKRFMTIGPVRYGMRLGAVSPPPPGAGPRYRSRTCCWSALTPQDKTTPPPTSTLSSSSSSTSTSSSSSSSSSNSNNNNNNNSRIPLIPTTITTTTTTTPSSSSSSTPINSLDIISCANISENASSSSSAAAVVAAVAAAAAVTTTTTSSSSSSSLLEETQTVRDHHHNHHHHHHHHHVLYQGGGERRREGWCLLNKQRCCALLYSRLLDANHQQDDFSTTLDRLPRFRFGGNRTSEKRGTDKFRELTERLKRTSGGISTTTTNTTTTTTTTIPNNLTITPVPPPRRHTRIHPSPLSEQPIYQQKRVVTLPSRSASFSQVDFCSDDNKYVRRHHNNHQDVVNSSSSNIIIHNNSNTNNNNNNNNTLPRPKNLVKQQNHFDTTNLLLVRSQQQQQQQQEISSVDGGGGGGGGLTTTTQDCSSRRRSSDRSRRRKGIYLSQWPTDLYSSNNNQIENNILIPQYENAIEEILLNSPSDVSSSVRKNEIPNSLELLNNPNTSLAVLTPPEISIIASSNTATDYWPITTTNNYYCQFPDKLKVSQTATTNNNCSLLRSDSLSEEGEHENSQFSLNNSNIDVVTDCDGIINRFNNIINNNDLLSPISIPRRYSKRPLRGPYGQMLEAEMKKPERKNNTDLKFLDDLSSNNKTTTKNSSSNRAPRSSSSASAPSNSSIDDKIVNKFNIPSSSACASTSSNSGGGVVKRKISVDNLINAEPSMSSKQSSLIPNHQRTISSPSKLEVFTPKPEISKEIIEQLLRSVAELLESKELGQLIRKDTRTHVLLELLENESIYVESLNMIITCYADPLKKIEPSVIEPGLVEEIFYQIPFLLTHHSNFLSKLFARFQKLDSCVVVVGDLFLDMLATPDLIENYVIYINSWKRSRDIIKNAQSTKPQFSKFLEAALKTTSRKLTVDSLLIKPIQKFPKYELLLQRLIKHTTPDYPDFDYLTRALSVVHDQLLLINCTEKETLDIEQLRELEGLIEGAADLVTVERQLIRNDMVVMSSNGGGPKKDRVLFLLTDLLLITGVKRRSGTITKKSNISINTTNLEANKYKLIMKIPLEDIEIVRSKDEKVRTIQLELNRLNEDIAILNKITELSLTLHCNHSSVDDLIREMINNLNKQVQIQQSNDVQQCELHLSVITQNGIESISIEFHKSDIRASWEESLMEYQGKLGDRRPTPELFAILPIRKTRAGLVLSSAVPTYSDNGRDLWLCNSDGHVGQICILNINDKTEPTVTSCNGVCNSRILCMAAVPGSELHSRASSLTSIKSREKLYSSQKAVQYEESSSSSDDEDEDLLKNDPKEAESSNSVYSDDSDKSTMWIGTEEGCIQIYNSNDNIRIKRNKVKLQLGSAVLSIVYMDDRVYASQANGYLFIYEKDEKGEWNTSNPRRIPVGNSNTPISKMIVWNSKIICACVNTVAIFDPQTFEKETIITINIDHSKDSEYHQICSLLVTGHAIWLSMQNSAIIKCYNVVTYELICETSVAPAVQRMLSCYDHIIRQHKAACLRVTSLLICRDLLWIGTSAGVVLTMSLPHVTPTTGKIPRLPSIIGVPHGNTGQVRVLATIDLPFTLQMKETPSKKNSKGKSPSTSADIPTTIKTTKYLVISGGEGYEDFRSSAAAEGAGREDSTNHVLLWTI